MTNYLQNFLIIFYFTLKQFSCRPLFRSDTKGDKNGNNGQCKFKEFFWLSHSTTKAPTWDQLATFNTNTEGL